MTFKISGMAAVTLLCCATALTLLSGESSAQVNQTLRIAAKSGETIELFPVLAQVNCRSTLLATPEVEVLQGPAELTVSAREQMVTAPRTECPNKFKGAMIIVTVGEIKQPIEGKLTFRVKFKTKAVNNQLAYTYNYSLFP